MKIYQTIICIASMLILNTPSYAQQPVSHGTMGYASYIRGQNYPVRLVDETFRDQPSYSPASKSPPPLDVANAYHLAYDQFLRVQEPNIEYDVESISLNRFHKTDWWFYVVAYRPSSDWKTVEPYRTLLQDKSRHVYLPCINIVVLMNGKTIAPQQWGPGYPSQGAGSPDP